MKKVLSVFIATILLICSLVSCVNTANDPLALADQFEEKNYDVGIAIDDDEIKELANEIDIRAKGIKYILHVAPQEEDEWDRWGIFIFCEDIKTAKNAAEGLREYIDENEDFKEEVARAIVEQEGALVFVGCEDAWEDRK